MSRRGFVEWGAEPMDDDNDDQQSALSPVHQPLAPRFTLPTMIAEPAVAEQYHRQQAESNPYQELLDRFAQETGSQSSVLSAGGSSTDQQQQLNNSRAYSAPPHLMAADDTHSLASVSTSPGRKRVLVDGDSVSSLVPLRTGSAVCGATSSMGDIHQQSGLFPSLVAVAQRAGNASAPRRTFVMKASSNSRSGSPSTSYSSPNHSPTNSGPVSITESLSESFQQMQMLRGGFEPSTLSPFEAELADPAKHITIVERFLDHAPVYAYSRRQIHTVVKLAHVVGMESAIPMLESAIAKPLISVFTPCIAPTVWITAPHGRGCRTLVRSFCMQAGRKTASGKDDMPPIANLITYRYGGRTEIEDKSFFPNLFNLAESMSPCVVLIHRVFSRALKDEAYLTIYADISAAYVPYAEKYINLNAPPFWLCFVETHPPESFSLPFHISPRRSCLLTRFSSEQVVKYMCMRMRFQLGTIVESEADIEELMALSYNREIERIAIENPDILQSPPLINLFVKHLFYISGDRSSVPQLDMQRAIRQLDPDVHLPFVPAPGDNMCGRGSDFTETITALAAQIANDTARANVENELRRKREESEVESDARLRAQANANKNRGNSG